MIFVADYLVTPQGVNGVIRPTRFSLYVVASFLVLALRT